MKKKKPFPLLWLLLIPGQLVVGILFVVFGSRLDLALFSNGEGGGHGIPIFTVIFLLIATVSTLAVIVLALVLTIRGFRQRKKENHQVSCGDHGQPVRKRGGKRE